MDGAKLEITNDYKQKAHRARLTAIIYLSIGNILFQHVHSEKCTPSSYLQVPP